MSVSLGLFAGAWALIGGYSMEENVTPPQTIINCQSVHRQVWGLIGITQGHFWLSKSLKLLLVFSVRAHDPRAFLKGEKTPKVPHPQPVPELGDGP